MASFNLVASATAILFIFIWHRFYRWFHLSHIPGPPSAGWSSWWMVKRQWNGNLAKDIEAAVTKYGPIVRVAPNMLVTSDAAELRRMWGARSRWNRSFWWYRALRFDPPNDNIASTIDDKAHEALRGKLIAGYNGKDIESLHPRIDEQVLALINLIERKYVSRDCEFKKLDLAVTAHYFTVDVLSHIAFGGSFQYLEKDDDVFGYIKISKHATPLVFVFALMPPLLWALHLIRPLFPKLEDVIGFGPLVRTAREIVSKRFGENKVVLPDMMGSFIDHGATKQEVQAESLVQLIAGTDTTATAIRATMMFIMTAPLVYTRLQNEIDEAVLEGRASSPVIANEEAKMLPYLQAVVKESLRVLPPSTAIVPKVSEHDEVICGTNIPKGTNVAWAVLPTVHDKAVFGDDADLFNPERWLSASPDKLKAMETSASLVFGGPGKWGCLGKTIALIELNKVLFELLRRFDFTVANPQSPWDSHSTGIFIQANFNVKVTYRQVHG